MRQWWTVCGLGIVLLSVPALSNAAERARDQLNRGTSGSQATGVTFDGGHTPTDAYPRGNVDVPPVTGRSVDTSSGTASGYSVGTSSGTASGSRSSDSSSASSDKSEKNKSGTEATGKKP